MGKRPEWTFSIEDKQMDNTYEKMLNIINHLGSANWKHKNGY
jgi:hemerythrin